MEREVVVGGILISISFLLAVMLNHSAMDAAPVGNVNAETGGVAVRVAPRSSSVNPPVASPPVRTDEATLKPSQGAGGEARHDDCSEKQAEHAATAQKRSDACSS